jgi:hypothetical protein
LTGETEVPGENLPQRHFVHHKSHMTRPTANNKVRPLLQENTAEELYLLCYNVVNSTDVSEEHVASNFRVEE